MAITKKNFPLYRSLIWDVTVDVRFEQDTLWLTQKQIAALFWVQRPAITKHFKNIFETWELNKNSVSSILEHTAEDWKNYKTKHYNLDAIISVWYRVNSKKATWFRQRANSILKQYVLDWYALNEQKLTENQEALLFVSKKIEALTTSWSLTQDESDWLLRLMTRYVPGLITLWKYDTDSLSGQWSMNEQKYILDLAEANDVLHTLKIKMLEQWEATDLFVQPRAEWLDGIFWAVYQWFWWKDVYPTVEEKAANLLYLIIKNHPFADGNKRSWSFLFVWYLSKNWILLNAQWEHKINEQTLVALAILVATSNPQEKEMMVKLIIALL